MRVAAGVVVLVICAAVAASVYMVIHHRHAQAEQQRAAEFAAAARQGVVTLMSLNFKTAKDDVQRIIDNSTGDFKNDFESSAGDFTKVAEQSKVTTEATVNATGVKSMTDNSAQVIVAATSRITNAAGAKQDPRTWRLVVDVVRDGDRIKMSKVEFAP
jgi:Mce-associated membrane protein